MKTQCMALILYAETLKSDSFSFKFYFLNLKMSFPMTFQQKLQTKQKNYN